VIVQRPCQRVGLVHHAAAEVDPIHPPGILGEGACEEPRPACHLSDAPTRRGTGHPHDQLQESLICHGAALQVVGDLTVKLGAHLRLYRCRLLVSHDYSPQAANAPS
jgi:hypothetical protein